MKAVRIPLIILLILLFIAIFLWGSVLEPFTGEGIYLAEIGSKDGVQSAYSIIRFDPNEGSRQMFSMFNFMYNNYSGDDEPYSITKTQLEYSGNYFKPVFTGLYLRPTGLHFPVFSFEPGDRLTMDWSVTDLVSLDVKGNVLEQEWKNISHRSQVIINGDDFKFDNVVYKRLDPVPGQYQEWIDMLDRAMLEKNP